MKVILSILVFVSMCAALEKKVIDGDYFGYWAQTAWSYHFQSDGTFKFESSGHFGNTFSSGRYTINGDTLILNSLSIDTLENKEGFLKLSNDKYLIDGDSCIIGLSLGYDYCKNHMEESQDPETGDKWIYHKGSRQRIKKK